MVVCTHVCPKEKQVGYDKNKVYEKGILKCIGGPGWEGVGVNIRK